MPYSAMMSSSIAFCVYICSSSRHIQVFKKRELIFAEGEVDTTYYLLQKGEALLRFQCPRDGTPQQVSKAC